MESVRTNICSIIEHMSNNIVNKEQLVINEFTKHINNSVSFPCVYKKINETINSVYNIFLYFSTKNMNNGCIQKWSIQLT